jgi:[acyl-carrier-protein] S-malonyltransferase
MQIVFLFPGQGSQYVGMGKDLYEASPITSEVYETAEKIFNNYHGDKYPKSLKEVSFEGPEDLLKRTVYTQPAILTHSLALTAIIKEDIAKGKLMAPSFSAGHSLGEFSALYMADLLSLEDVIKLVIKRADLMENAPSGAMSAIVGMDEDTLRGIIQGLEGVSVANYNAPDQIVITGTVEGVTNAENAINKHAEANALKVRVIRLAVGGAFHSPLMEVAAREFAKHIDAANFASKPSMPIIQNYTGMPVSDSASIKNNLKKQMTGAVQWTETVRFILSKENDGVNIESAYEIGPGKVLAGLVKKQERRFPVTNIQALADLESIAATTVH